MERNSSAVAERHFQCMVDSYARHTDMQPSVGACRRRTSMPVVTRENWRWSGPHWRWGNSGMANCRWQIRWIRGQEQKGNNYLTGVDLWLSNRDHRNCCKKMCSPESLPFFLRLWIGNIKRNNREVRVDGGHVRQAESIWKKKTRAEPTERSLSTLEEDLASLKRIIEKDGMSLKEYQNAASRTFFTICLPFFRV